VNWQLILAPEAEALTLHFGTISRKPALASTLFALSTLLFLQSSGIPFNTRSFGNNTGARASLASLTAYFTE